MIKIGNQCKNSKEINYSSSSTSSIAPLIQFIVIVRIKMIAEVMVLKVKNYVKVSFSFYETSKHSN